MVQSRVSFSLDCQSPAETDSDRSTMPVSVGEPSSPRPKYPRSMCQRARCNRIACKLPCHALLSIFPERRRHQLAALCAHELGCFCEQTDAVQRQEVRFVDDLVESKRIGLVIARPLDQSRISATLDDAAFGAATSEQSR